MTAQISKTIDLTLRILFYLSLLLISVTIFFCFFSGKMTNTDKGNLFEMSILSIGLYAMIDEKETPVINRILNIVKNIAFRKNLK